MTQFDPIFAALQATGVRYVVVGGVAVNLHGYQRFTKDIDCRICRICWISTLKPKREIQDCGGLSSSWAGESFAFRSPRYR
jgi:hypothetical protein